MVENSQNIFVTFDQNFYQIIKFFPNMTFLLLIINIANVFNAWHGLSFVRFLDLLSIFFQKISEIIYCYEKIRIIMISNNRFSINQFEVKSKLCYDLKFKNLKYY